VFASALTQPGGSCTDREAPQPSKQATIESIKRRAFPRRGSRVMSASMPCMVPQTPRRSQLLKGVLDMCLLAVIDEESAYGYEMTQRLRERGLSTVAEGSIYPLLARLVREGLVESYRQESDGGPPRKYYRTTPRGRRALARYIDEWEAARDAVDSVLCLAEVDR
jgi:PadR family transcriptional regulator PadR